MAQFRNILSLASRAKCLRKLPNGIRPMQLSQMTSRRHFSNERMQTFTVYRWDPHKEAAPEERSYEVDVSDCPMILDVLFKIKNQQDPVLSTLLFYLDD